MLASFLILTQPSSMADECYTLLKSSRHNKHHYVFFLAHPVTGRGCAEVHAEMDAEAAVMHEWSS